MATIIAILGGLGLFLLGMSVMTDGLKALAGSALREVLARAAATPARGTLWGAVVTILVQSSSATTMTTIGLVSAGLLTFPQGLSVVFGANIGTTATGWLVALLGVRVSLTAAAMPIVFVGAFMKLLGKGRWAGAGSAIAGFALILIGLTTLQDGMGGLAERLNPADLPSVLTGEGVALWRAALGVLLLVVVGLIMTTVMQSSSAAVAATLSALYAGAIAPEQAMALIIGQNIGTAVSTSLAAIGTTTPAKRTAVGYVLFKVITAMVMLALFPLMAPLIRWASGHTDPTILLAGYHTAYNIIGVGLLLPLIRPFSRGVERIVPQRGPVLTRYLDKSVMNVNAVAVEAVRRTVAGVLSTACRSVIQELSHPGAAASRRQQASVHLAECAAAADQARLFLSQVSDAPASDNERQRLANTIHALDHTSRFVEAAMEHHGVGPAGSEEESRAREMCERALRTAADIASVIVDPETPEPTTHEPVAELETLSKKLADLRRDHRRTTLDAAASGEITAESSIARVEAVRRMDRLGYHAWRAAAHLEGVGAAQPVVPVGGEVPNEAGAPRA